MHFVLSTPRAQCKPVYRYSFFLPNLAGASIGLLFIPLVIFYLPETRYCKVTLPGQTLSCK